MLLKADDHHSCITWMVYMLDASDRSCQDTNTALQPGVEDDKQKLTVSWLMRRSDSPSSRSGRASDTMICRFSVLVLPPLIALFTLNIAHTSHILRDTPLLNMADAVHRLWCPP